MYEDKTYSALLQDVLNEVSAGVQTGEGYLVYNALSALAYELEKVYIQMDYIMNQSHADTADLEELIEIAKDRGIYQKKATHAYVEIKGNTVIPIGTRFSLKSFNYKTVEAINEVAHTYKAMCEETGTGPNNLTGELIAIDYVDGLEKAEITEVLINGEEDESRDALYARYLASFTSESFGGNIAQYKQYVNAIAGVGGCKVQPVWNGAGTVKVVAISSEHGACSEYLVQQIQTAACPTQGSGYGFAPIDHDVTVVSVDAVKVNVTAKLSYMSGYSWSSLKDTVTAKISEYLKSLAAVWADGDQSTKTTVYVAKLQAAVLDVPGVVDITDTQLNGATGNLILDWDQIPVVGEVSAA
mgnify:CR=1 FL=1